jgi:hypothetical protein
MPSSCQRTPPDTCSLTPTFACIKWISWNIHS